MKKAQWHIKDLIDLEYFQKQDEIREEESGYHPLAKRDRKIYMQSIRPMEKKSQAPADADAIRYWLEQRRDREKAGKGSEKVLPGEAFEEIRRLLFYGLLPRTILLMTGFFSQKRRLGRIGFRHAACERLLHRMKTPLITTEGSPEDSRYPHSDATEDKMDGTHPAEPGTGAVSTGSDLIVLVPGEIFDDCKDDELEYSLSLSPGYSIRKKIRRR